MVPLGFWLLYSLGWLLLHGRPKVFDEDLCEEGLVRGSRSWLVQWQHKFSFVCGLPMGPICDTACWEEGGQGLLKKTTFGGCF